MVIVVPLKVGKDIGIILDVVESVQIGIAEVIFLVGVGAKSDFVLSNDGGRICVVLDASGLEFHVDGIVR